MSFFIWTHGQEKLDSFLEELNRYNSYLKFTYESSKTSILFLDLKVSLSYGDLSTDLHIKSTDRQQFYITHRLIFIILSAPLFTGRPLGLVGYAFLNILRV